ncbi:SRPBCC family protein [Nocardia wallacei]|uniref:SRPBCC family protein n=1 Tax=Nocardia wallacei TaxID=480035 RepID=UPI002458FB98|nr:SRPBCC family protein [Nocardia wallacei]
MTEPLVLRVRTTATPEAAFAALTEEKAVTNWLAEHARIDLPNVYEFWGPSVPEGDAPHQTVRSAEDGSLSITWLLDGAETTTDIAVGTQDGETVVTVTQSHFSFDAMMTGAVHGVLQTFWALALANLVDYLEGREITARADFTSADFSATVQIDAPVDRVYESLISSEQASAWFGYPIEIEPEVGGRFAMGGIENNPNPAHIVDLVPGERVSVNWGPGGIGTWELEGSDGGTRLTLTSSGFDENNPPYAGWLGNLSGLAELRRYHEIEPWRPITVAA